MRTSKFHGTNINPKGYERGQLKFFVLLIPVAILMGLPILYIISHAFKPMSELFAYPPRFFVQNATLENFTQLFKSMDLSGVPASRYLFNSVLATLSVVVLTVLVSAAAAYALSKKRFKFKNVLFEINTLALMFIATAVSIPRYLVIVNMNLYDNFLVQILPFVALPTGIFLVKQFVDQLPDSLIEAARIDGASDLRIFRSIILPLIKPALATVAILSFQSVWTNVEPSTMFIDQEALKTFAFYISTLSSSGNAVAGQGVVAAASLLTFIPNLIIFIVMQNKVMDTMAHSGIK